MAILGHKTSAKKRLVVEKNRKMPYFRGKQRQVANMFLFYQKKDK
jgi:hypothetical protein